VLFAICGWNLWFCSETLFSQESTTRILQSDLELLVSWVIFAEIVEAMETNDKNLYEVPQAEVLTVKIEGSVCTSSGFQASRQGYGTASGEYEQEWD